MPAQPKPSPGSTNKVKLFGQFLMDKNVISKESFIRAKTLQANGLPSLPAAVYELKLLSIEDQLKVFEYQTTYLKDYRLSCVELGLWNEEAFEHTLLRFFLSRIRPIGEILKELGLINEKELEDLRLEYKRLDSASDSTSIL